MAGAATEERTARQSWGLQAALVTAEPVSVREHPAERDFSLVSILQPPAQKDALHGSLFLVL